MAGNAAVLTEQFGGELSSQHRRAVAIVTY
jgi:hypothetical protein